MSLEEHIKDLAAQGTREALERYLPELLARLELPRDPEKLYRYQEAASYLGTTKGAVEAKVKAGELYAIQLGNERFIPHKSISDFIAKHEAKAKHLHSKSYLTNDVPDDIAKLLGGA